MKITLENAETADAESMAAIQKQAFESLYRLYRDNGSPYLRGIDEIKNWLADSSRMLYKILLDGSIVGGIAVFDRGNGEYYLTRLYILPELQGNGIGAKAISLCEEFYPDSKRWSLDYPEDRTANKKCYEKCGYTDTGVREVKNDKLKLVVCEKNVNGIFQIRLSQLSLAAEVIRAGFTTVAEEFRLTRQNCPNHTSFITAEKLKIHYSLGWLMFGLFKKERLVGCVSLSDEGGGVFKLHNLSVLPECRHNGYGEDLLGFCKEKVKKSSGTKIEFDIIEENTRLKNWYEKNGFTHTGIEKFPHLPFTVGYMEWK